jgi:transposase
MMRIARAAEREPSAMSISMIGLDTAKSVFHVHAVDETGQMVLRRKLQRSELLAFFKKLEDCRLSWKHAGQLIIGLAC